MTTETVQGQKERPFWRRMLRGIAFMPFGLLPMSIFVPLFGGIGVAIGILAMVGAFVQGFSGERLLGGSPPATAAEPRTAVVAAEPPAKSRRRGLWWKIPASVVAGFVTLVMAGVIGPEKPKDATTNVGIGERAADLTPPGKDKPAAIEAKTEANPMEKYRSFKQRACNGIDDCTLANIEAEQTQASRDFNRTARMSIAKALLQLGAPTYVLRAGDVVGQPEYEGNPTEMRFADAIVGWQNGACAPNELHVTTRGGQTMVSPMPGGGFCSKDGSAYPLPGANFACAGGRKGDALCTTAGLQKLPGMADERGARAPATDNDPVFNAGRHHGYLAWAARNCPGRISETFKAASTVTRGRGTQRFDAGVEEGGAEMRRAAAKSDASTACATVQFLYGPAGQNIAGAWVQ